MIIGTVYLRSRFLLVAGVLNIADCHVGADGLGRISSLHRLPFVGSAAGPQFLLMVLVRVGHRSASGSRFIVGSLG